MERGFSWKSSLFLVITAGKNPANSHCWRKMKKKVVFSCCFEKFALTEMSDGFLWLVLGSQSCASASPALLIAARWLNDVSALLRGFQQTQYSELPLGRGSVWNATWLMIFKWLLITAGSARGQCWLCLVSLVCSSSSARVCVPSTVLSLGWPMAPSGRVPWVCKVLLHRETKPENTANLFLL